VGDCRLPVPDDDDDDVDWSHDEIGATFLAAEPAGRCSILGGTRKSQLLPRSEEEEEDEGK